MNSLNHSVNSLRSLYDRENLIFTFKINMSVYWDYIPKKDTDLRFWSANFTAVLAANTEAWVIPAGEVSDLQAAGDPNPLPPRIYGGRPREKGLYRRLLAKQKGRTRSLEQYPFRYRALN
jgi:hypothetical protein